MAEKTKKGKKQWVEIVGSSDFKNQYLGESYVSDINQLLGKTVIVNVSRLLEDMKKQQATVTFKVNEIKGDQALAAPVTYEMLSAHTRRLVRTNKDKIEDSFVIESKDKIKLRIKPITLTRNKTKNSVLTKIRMKTREYFINFAAKSDFKTILVEVMRGDVQKSLRNDMKKIYPLSIFEIRKIEVLNR